MATNKNDYPGTKPTSGSISHKDLHVPKGKAGAYLAANKIGEVFEKHVFPVIGRGRAYVASQWTVTDGGTGDAWAESSAPGGGLKITTPSDDNFDMELQSVQGWTPSANKTVSLAVRFYVNDADKIGFHIGLGNTQTLPFTTDFTDKVVIQKAITSTAVVGSVRGNSGTAASSGTLATCTDGGVIDAGFWFRIGSSASTSSGAWYCNGVWTPFTSAQQAQLYAILTSPPTMYFTIACTGTTGANYNMTVVAAQCEVDN